MNLQQLIEQYIGFRQALGESFKTSAILLRAFGRAAGAGAAIADVRAEQVNAFLGEGRPVTSNWHVRYNALRGLYRYALSRGFAAEAPLPAVVPKQPPRFVPYIYSREELRRLLKATDECRHPLRLVEPITLRTILLLLYGAGLRVSEALALDCADVDLGSSLITIRGTKFYKSRLVPLGTQLTQALIYYAAWRRENHPPLDSQAPFFVGRLAARLYRGGLGVAFRRVCTHAGVRRADGVNCRPRLHDCRHAFAVHRLTAWYQQGADVQRLLPQLSVYMGHAHLSSTQFYLSMTPELLQQAGDRFEQYARQEDRHD